MVQPFTKLLLPSGISGDAFFSIARQVKELSLIDFHGLVTLNKVAELSLLACYNCLRNIAGAKSSLELHPSNDSSRR
jgi:hypothetical protein